MRTDERHDPAESAPNSPEHSGLWGRLADRVSAAVARLRDALSADPPSAPAKTGADPDRRPDRHTEAAVADDGDAGELTVSRADGHLRVAEGPGAYIESDTWETVER
jgi:hypothetical protein